MEKERTVESAMEVVEILMEVHEELDRATAKFGPFLSAHEGYAIIKEEVDELWDEVKKGNRQPELMRKEAIQIAAMAVRFVLDLYGRNFADDDKRAKIAPIETPIDGAPVDGDTDYSTTKRR